MFSWERKIENKELCELVKRTLSSPIIDEYLLFGPESTCLPSYYGSGADAIDNFQIRNDDVIVASFLKSGSTWLQEMVWLLKNELDYDGAKVEIHERFPKLELPGLGDPNQPNRDNSVEKLSRLTGPRLIKTHLPFSLLPRRTRDGCDIPKIIYIMRNPKDAFISYYHFGLAAFGWRATKEDLAKLFMGGPILYGPYWKNVLGYWKLRQSPNILILKYEEMLKDLRAVIGRTCEFLEREPLTNEQMEKLCGHLSFNSMKDNSAVNYAKMLNDRKKFAVNSSPFMRCGKVGQYEREMSPQMIAEFDEWIRTSIEGTDFSEKYAYCGKDD